MVIVSKPVTGSIVQLGEDRLTHLEVVEEREQQEACEHRYATESYNAFQHSVIHHFWNFFLIVTFPPWRTRRAIRCWGLHL